MAPPGLRPLAARRPVGGRRLAASAARVEALARQDPDARVRFGRSLQEYSPAEVLHQLAERRAGLERDAGLARFRFGAATVTVLGGGVALLAVLSCLGATAYARSRAMPGVGAGGRAWRLRGRSGA